MRKSTTSINLVVVGSALTIAGCGGNQQQAQRITCDKKLPDGKPDPQCVSTSSSSGHRSSFIFFGGLGGGGSSAGAKSGVAPSSCGARSGFGATGGSTGGGSTGG